MSATAITLAALVLALSTGGIGYWHGTSAGQASAKAAQDAQAVTDLTEIITAHKGLIKEAGAASGRIRKAVAARELADNKTTKEVSDELTATSDSRAGCVFPAGVMRGLAEARERSAQAAASGIGSPVPAARGSAAPDW